MKPLSQMIISHKNFNCWNTRDLRGNSPIMLALKNREIGIFKLLSRCPKVDLNTKDNAGATLGDIARLLFNAS